MNSDKLLENSTSSEISNNSQINKKLIILPRKKRFCLYSLILLTNFSFFIIFGVIPPSVKNLKIQYNLSDAEFGLFGSFLFSGKICGSLIFIFLFKILQRKILLLINIFINIFFIFLMINTTNKYFLYCAIFPMGIANVFCLIYFPIWCDQYGFRKDKGKFLTVFQLSIRVGNLFGQLMTPLLGWKKVLVIEGMILVFAFLMFIFVDEKFLSDKLFSALTNDDEANNSNLKSVFIEVDNNKKDSNKNNENNKRSFSNRLKNNCKLLAKKTFIVYVLARSFLLFTTSTLETWQYDFIEDIFNISSSKEIIKYLSTLQITSVGSGILLSLLVGKFIQNYGSFTSGLICLIFYSFACISYQILPFTTNFSRYCIAEWIALFFRSAIMPNLIGLIITSVDNKDKPSANSLSSLISNTLGHMPAPYVYGLLKEKFTDDERIPLRICCYFSIVAEMFFCIGAILKYKYLKKKKNKKRNEVSKNINESINNGKEMSNFF